MSINVPVPRLKRTVWVCLALVGHPLCVSFLLWWRIGRVCSQNAKFGVSLYSHGIHGSIGDPIRPCCVTIDIHRCKTEVGRQCAGGNYKSYVCTGCSWMRSPLFSMLCCLLGRGRSTVVVAMVDDAYCSVKTLSVHWMVLVSWCLVCLVLVYYVCF